ncbi:MAG: methylmalonyl-CoA epimerase [Thermomicrobiales bacterium]
MTDVRSLIGSRRLHHVGIVVSDLDAADERYRALGFTDGDRFAVPEQLIEAITYHAGPSGYLELIAPTDPAGAIARFMAKRGEGTHHVAFAVDDLAAELRDLAMKGVRLIDEVPRIGAHGWRVAFVHPESCNGVLVELVQEPPQAVSQE